MRDVIYNELMKVYATGDRKPEVSTYAGDVNSWLAERLENYLQTDSNPTRREVINWIWMSWPGGGTAEIAGDNILKALDLELPEY
jgi:hypothetical protein